LSRPESALELIVWLRARANAKLFSITMDQHQTEARTSPIMTNSPPDGLEGTNLEMKIAHCES